MSSFFAFAPHRTKRKMSGPAGSIALDIEAAGVKDGGDLAASTASGGSSSTATALSGSSTGIDSKGNSAEAADGKSLDSSARWFSALCKTVDVREVLGFMLWEALIVLIVALAVADWVFFFKLVVQTESNRARAKWGTLWALFTLALLAFRSAVRAKCGAHVRSLADHAEIFIAVSLLMVFSINVAFYVHVPSSMPLRDLGFMLIPAQAENSKWRPVSDLLTAVLPVVFMMQTYFMTRENRCRVISSFFRVATISYALRTLTVSLTSLPGPAPHCRPGSPLYLPPQNWIDIVTRVGPMYGKFNSCGDLIFSGHMAYTNSALLLYLRVLDRYYPCRFSRLRWHVGIGYLILLAGLCVSGRKHYTVDVVLGLMISTLVFFHFEHSWVPLGFLHGQQQAIVLPATRKSGLRKYFHGYAKITEEDANDDDEDERYEYERYGQSSNDQLLFRKTPTSVDYIC